MAGDPRGGRNYAGLSREERVAQRRTRLIDAALELFGTQGYATTPIERLCTVANVSTRSFYEDVGSREALLIALADRVCTRAVDQAISSLTRNRAEPLAVRMLDAFRSYLAVTSADQRSARVLYVEVVGVSPAVEEWRREQRRLLASLLVGEARRAAERGEIKSRRFELFALAVIGSVHALAQELVQSTMPGGAVSLDEICAEIAFFVDCGLGLG
ncbi:TetR/AcrR family transcriptional regulator [Nocardia sp. NPDC048505]|uniref:TetR/AcrR family transcriptional regulator n=1 Tax=Nocardia sp. NPDC048505 TaxID=3155756 RepID=UPI0033F200FE